MSASVLSIARGVVRHTRLRPAQHAFAYRVAFLRVRVDRLDGIATPFGFAHNRFHLFSLHDADYLDGTGPLAPRMRALLQSHGIDDADGALWLHTFPRVLGYVFNPVSFWFCERRDGALRAVVAEVNNTFGERHCYLLAHRDGQPIRNGEELEARKVFHVSPFCEVDGQYRFRFMHRMAGDRVERTVARIDYADAHGDLLLTSVSGSLADATAARLVAAWLAHPMLTLGIVARIHFQAMRLFFKRVPFFHKPDPPEATVTR